MKNIKQLMGACLMAVVSTTCAAQNSQNAQTYPTKPIRWIVPYTPGGYTDNVTRMVTARLQTLLGQTIIVENKPGANSIIGADMVAKAAPDGYTMLTVITAHAANATLYDGRLPFDFFKNLAPVSLVAVSPLILTVSKDFPAKNMAELIAYAKANPGKVSYGSSGVGSAAHLTSELLSHTAGIEMVHIPYKGTAPAVADLMANNIQMLIDVPSSMMTHVNGGKVRALGLFAQNRLPVAPEVPTISQSGGPAIDSSSWVMFLAPGGTPQDIQLKLAQAVEEVVQSPEMKARFAELGIIAVGSMPGETTKFLKEEVKKWGDVIKTANVKAE